MAYSVVGGILFNKRCYPQVLSYFERANKTYRYGPKLLALEAKCRRYLSQMAQARPYWHGIF